MSERPNVIVVLCDQLRAFELGCYGHEVVRTPNVDRLAREGVRFEQALTTNPVCTPARSALLSGQHARTCAGALGNDAPDPRARRGAGSPTPRCRKCWVGRGTEPRS